MEIQDLEVQRREITGKGFARKLRAKGLIPAVCYRKDFEPISLSLERKVLKKLFQTASGQNLLIKLIIKSDQGPDEQQTVILKEAQRNYMSELVHADFMVVLMDEAITVEAPLRFTGEPVEALRAGGLVQQLKRVLEVECLPGNIPDILEIDISELNIGESLHVGDVKVAEGVRILTDPKESIVVISAPRAEEEEVEGEEGEEEAEAAAGEADAGTGDTDTDKGKEDA